VKDVRSCDKKLKGLKDAVDMVSGHVWRGSDMSPSRCVASLGGEESVQVRAHQGHGIGFQKTFRG
jgi:hypothetical protein